MAWRLVLLCILTGELLVKSGSQLVPWVSGLAGFVPETISSFCAAPWWPLARQTEHVVDFWGSYQLRLTKSLAPRAVKQDRIAVCLPYCRQAQRPRASEQEVHATRCAAAYEDSLIEGKYIGVESFGLTKVFVYVTSYGK
jgi:hypothetical protein